MTLDRDLERMRFGYRCAAGVNMALAFGQLQQGNVFIALTAALWALLCGYMAHYSIQTHQRTRDQCRMVREMMDAARQELAEKLGQWPDD